jgi:hypothetical protein
VSSKTGALALSVLPLLMILSACQVLQPLTDRSLEHEITRYRENIDRWNTLAAGHAGVRPLAPVQPSGGEEALLPALREINTLFRISFAVLAATTVPEQQAAPNPPSASPASLAEKLRDRVVTIYLEKGQEGPPPFVKGLLLSRSGWVMTVQHPFSLTDEAVKRVYATLSGREEAVSLELHGAFDESNLLLAKFDLPSEGKERVLHTAFGKAEKGEEVYLALDELRSLEIAGTDRELMLSEKQIFADNIIARAEGSMAGVVSGSVLFNAMGEVLGLYYLHSDEREIHGFASIGEMPGQIRLLIARYQRLLSPRSLEPY